MASTQKYVPTRTIRIDDETWERAKARAAEDGLTVSAVMARFVTGYATGKINAPQTRIVYSTK